MRNLIAVTAFLLISGSALADDKPAAPPPEKTVTLTQAELTRLVQAEVNKALAQQAAADVYKKLQDAFGVTSETQPAK